MNQQYGYQQPYSPPSNTLAIISLIASILGLTFMPTIGSIAGLIMGYIAKRQIEESGGTMGGAGMAKAGIIIGWVGVALFALAMCLILAYFVIVVLIAGGSFCALAGSGYGGY